MKMFRLNLFLPLLLVTFVMAFFTVFVIIYIQENSIHKSKESISEQFTKNLNEKASVEAAVISEYIAFIQHRDDISKLFLAQNKEQLNNSIKDVYNSLNKNVELTHMYFIRPDGRVLLRVHDYQRDNDIIKRTTFKKAKESSSLFYGLEFGPKKNYTLRVVKPWYIDGKLIGYIELGKEIDKIINELSLSLKTHIYMAAKKDIYKDSSEFAKINLSLKVQTSDYYIVYNTSTVPQEIDSILEGTLAHNDISLNNSEYFVSKTLLWDVSNKEIGYFVFLSDVTMEHSVMYGSIKTLSLILFLVVAGLIFGGYILIDKKENSIHSLTSKLEKKKNDLALFNVKLQKLFDLQKNIVIITDGKTIMLANQAMFDFFKFNNLNDFLKYSSCICDRFVVHDDFFHLDKVPEGENWVDVIKSMPGKNHIVAMLDDDETFHAFSVSISEFEEGNYIVSFTDISNTMVEHNKLKRKVMRDKLTGALNREFFDKNIELIVKDVYPKNLGVVICDIDYFKLVNDNYGHNRGDVVLKEFTDIIRNSIRESDYLIRWGGEEFIILMKVNNIDSLYKATENIRKAIEDYSFDEVGQITSSFGLTLYIEGEVLTETIARVDKALYTAKDKGRNQLQVL